MGEFIFVVTLCMSTSSQLITEVVRANNESGAIAAAIRMHSGWMACGTPKKIGLTT